jgi:hypothetical protein
MSNSEHIGRLSQLPYWQMNVPPDQRTEQCPYFLLDVSDKDRAILSTRDEDYQRSSWEQVKNFISMLSLPLTLNRITSTNLPRTAQNNLARFRRVPSDLRRYLEFKSDIQKKYGSMLNYVRQKRLYWPSVTPSGDPPFCNPSDYKILRNDWPYGIDEDITHLVVWTKFLLEADPVTDDIAPSARAAIENFVVKFFCDIQSGGLDRSRVIWFKNWTSLKSVDGIEHFHVMLYKAEEDFVNQITQGDRFKNLDEI